MSMEAAKFPSERVRLQLDEDGQGAIEFVTTEPLVTSVPGTAGYLCRGDSEPRCTTEAGIVGGFDYSLMRLESRGPVLSLSIALDEPWVDWCAFQSPQLIPGTGGCSTRYAPEAAYSAFAFGDACFVQRQKVDIPIDCSRLATLEREPCNCDANECRFAPARRQDIALRLVDDNELRGSIWFDGSHAVPLTLFREDPSTDP